MAKRSIEKKRLARLRKAIDRRPLPKFIDLVDFLQVRGYADTAGQARKLLTEGKVRVESHVVGRRQVMNVTAHGPKPEWVADPWISFAHKERIMVLA